MFIHSNHWRLEFLFLVIGSTAPRILFSRGIRILWDTLLSDTTSHTIVNDHLSILGKCTGKSDGCATGNQTCYAQVRKQYKFYLAFENSLCSEYITEKFWNTLTTNSYNIPIALGTTLEEYKRFAPPNSYLHTRNFTSIQALADYMHKVDNDNSLFNSYHKWRETHEIAPRRTNETLHCYMCRQANEKRDGKAKYKNLSRYWSKSSMCETFPEPIR